MTKKKKEETFQLTFKGWLLVQFDFDEEKATRFLNDLELFIRRRCPTGDDGRPALVLINNEFVAEPVYQGLKQDVERAASYRRRRKK